MQTTIIESLIVITHRYIIFFVVFLSCYLKNCPWVSVTVLRHNAVIMGISCNYKFWTGFIQWHWICPTFFGRARSPFEHMDSLAHKIFYVAFIKVTLNEECADGHQYSGKKKKLYAWKVANLFFPRWVRHFFFYYNKTKLPYSNRGEIFASVRP